MAAIFVAPSSLHSADENEKAENGCQLGERFDRSGYAVTEGSAGKSSEYQDWKGRPDQHLPTSGNRAPS